MQMVRAQIEDRDVKDPRVLAVMLKVPRHRFVPIDLTASAYEDCPLPLMLGQTISQPYIVGHMTQALDLHGVERVLEIGTGSGYQAAVLSDLASEVYSIEILPELAARARLTLDELQYKNIRIRCGDGYTGWLDAAPFDRIIVTAAPDHIPQPLIDQLSAGGRLVISRWTLRSGIGGTREDWHWSDPPLDHPGALRAHDGPGCGPQGLGIVGLMSKANL